MIHITVLLLSISVCLLARRVSDLEHNCKAIKEWLKVSGIIDIDRLTDEMRKWQESEDK